MLATGILPALLSALFHPDLDGDILVTGGANGEFSQDVHCAADVVAFADDYPDDARLQLATSAGVASAFVVFADEDPIDLADVAYRLIKAPGTQNETILNIRVSAPASILDNRNDCVLFEMPVPGYGGWQLDEASLARLADGVVTEESGAPMPVGAATSENVAAEAPESLAGADAPVAGVITPPDAPLVLKDAVFPRGAPSDAVLNLPMLLGFGKSRDEKRWVAQQRKFGDIIHLLAEHKDGPKDGPAFLQGSAVGHQRMAKAMKSMCLVGLDIDSGISIEWAIARVSEMNLAAIIYTTHSHLKPLTYVNQSSYAKWAKREGLPKTDPADADMRRYLIGARGWAPEIADACQVLGKEHESDGIAYKVAHPPMPKFRIVFPLDRPYTFMEQKGLMQLEAINRWKGRLLGLAKMIGVPIDESCLDPSRLFYLPRHSKDSPGWAVTVLAGAPLEFDAIPEVNPGADAPVEEDVFAAAARSIGIGSAPLMFGDFSLKKWAMTSAHSFMPAEMFRGECPERIRADPNTSKIEIECPFDHEHSNAGDTFDRAAYVIDSHADGQSNAFAWGCHHNCCRNRDRLEFICEALRSNWFDPDVLSNESYHALTLDAPKRVVDPELIAKDLYQQAQVLDPTDIDVVDESETILREAVRGNVTKQRLDMIIDMVSERTKQKKKDLHAVARDFRRQAALDEDEQDKMTRILSTFRIDHAGRQPVLIDGQKGYSEQMKILLESLLKYNRRDPTIFHYGEGRMIVHFDRASGRASVEPLDWLGLCTKLEELLFVKVTDEGATTIALPDRALKEIAASKSWNVPDLIGFASLPFYRADATLVTATGYDGPSCLFLKPEIDVRFAVPDAPTKAEITMARDYILDTVYGQFPFDDGPEFQATRGAGSRAHFLAMLLQPFLRAMIVGPTPIYLVSKPTAGTGASLLIRTALMINSGKARPDSNTESSHEEETRKNVTSAFRSGQTFYWVDNVNQDLRSTSYCNLATAAQWQDRVLGRSDLVSFPNKMQFIMSGNNPKGSYEVMRRCLPIRLDARSDPRERGDWKIEDLDDYVVTHRKQLVEAILTLINAWKAAGRPLFEGKPLMSFEAWSRVTGGVLDVAGVKGFLSNLHLTQKVADDETRNWEAFLQAWTTEKTFGLDRTKLVHELAELLIDQADFPPIVRYTDDAKAMAPHLRKALDSKIGAPYSVFVRTRTGVVLEDGTPETIEEKVVVTIARDKPHNGPMGYVLKKMAD